jgi:hypothetical protein
VSYGLTLGLRTNDPRVLDELRRRLPPGWKPARARGVDRLYSLLVAQPASDRGIRRFNLLYVNEVRLARSLELADVLTALESDLALYVAEHARGRLFLHAGVVGWHERAIVIPGRSMSGKSRLVAALLEAGGTYYSDEYAVLDGRGRVHAYPRALSLRDGSVPRPALPPVGRRRRALAPLAVGLVLLTRYRAGTRWRPRRLSPGRAGIAMLAHAVAARRRPSGALRVLARALSSARALKATRGEAADVARAVLAAASA